VLTSKTKQNKKKEQKKMEKKGFFDHYVVLLEIKPKTKCDSRHIVVND